MPDQAHEKSEAISTVDYLAKLQASAPSDVLKLDCTMAHEEERKYVTIKIPDTLKFEQLEIYHITDVQYGHKCCNVPRFVEYRDFILAAPNRFAVFGGDMFNAATMLSKGTPWEDTGTPIEQIYRFAELCMPMRHRILGYVGGNHEAHTRPTLGKSGGTFLASLLRIPYSEGQQYIRIWWGDWKPFKINLWHGSGGAVTKGGKAQRLEKFAMQGDAHLYLMGHLHDAMILPMFRIKDNVRGRVIGLEKYYVAMSSSFMEFWASYAEVKGLTPTDTIMALCTLWPNGKFRVVE